ncbi:hypothetical protein EF903_17980 [Streptomyces sp. WAC05292]|uniref:hypothetical protein n=1 Tax=Streptomyces sp. WAC05292 TaxID=2487418 RepID=UPI000F743AAA|nr:hypothetical protein [Streptomyces sp. WAC05292]RSS87001.1 hypothetical protein EF903_17980 [Streptomyces sp. WAC05292]
MQTLLLGRWDHGGNLLIEESHQIADDDQAAIDVRVDAQDDDDSMAWADSFPTATHREAIEAAYEEYVHEEHDGRNVGGSLIDQCTGLRLRKD